MFISEINIENFRNFGGSNNVIEFNEGVNVIIGHNNSGKSNLLRALELVLDVGSSKKLLIDDFNKNISIDDLKQKPPKVSITVSFSESDSEPEFSEDLVTVSTWLTNLESPYKAQLTYDFYLPEKEVEEYKKVMSEISSTDSEEYWRTIEHNFLRKYRSNIYGGNPKLKRVADSEALRKIDYQFLDAIRDVERDLFTGRNTLLREVIDFFMDYEIKNDESMEKQEQQAEINKLKMDFSKDAKSLIDTLRGRMKQGKIEMLRYANETGASFGNAEPDFDGHILDSELYAALRLIVKYQTGVKIPATHNGLGYNNLIYMSLLLAKMQKDASGYYLGSNAKVFPVLAIEEPEAHLHPAMQYKFLKFLKNNSEGKARQIFITTHSPNITAAVGLDEIICFHRKQDYSLNVAYLGRVFGEEDKKSKDYVERFLDATKSDMLFAKGIILVEGITEQLTMSTFARYVDCDLEDSHISVINIGGRYFEHFLKLFDSTKQNSIHKRVACITDLDPLRKKHDKGSFTKCYPFELDIDTEHYSYKSCSNNLVGKYGLSNGQSSHDNIVCVSQVEGQGKTFEYGLAYENPECKVILTNSISNAKELDSLFDTYKEGGSLEDMIKLLGNQGDENKRIAKSILQYEKSDDKKHLLAARYLNSIDKGENAYELAQALEENFNKGNKANFKVPEYIGEAVKWICK
ncbi:putative ATP-dependent endonuclease of OLD family [Virgibacillus natechei]|uniref:ATP-dependent endonuclease of OLD family n=1 Tax=Virgibacillus natechei TaxID=1216297 RepID=A0ABS4IKA0_9BACI|nr:AAA family ATPase [Virgibacillus natechei]MBP1970761.1 putative ATP-dependent endonuclease of OLD family [Virgibacillus natechei]UZD12331.1 AAA family ATPase [Virgibacillus natechei]